jgi:hypothetical protein
MKTNTTSTEPETVQSPADSPTELGATPCSSLGVASNMIRQQEYLLNRQEELMQAVVRRNRELVAAMNECHRENHKLRKELDGYKRGKLWTVITSMLPTLEMRFRDE